MLLRDIYKNLDEFTALNKIKVSRESWIKSDYSYAKIGVINGIETFIFSSGTPLHYDNLIADDWYILPTEKDQEKDQEKDNLDVIEEFIKLMQKVL